MGKNPKVKLESTNLFTDKIPGKSNCVGIANSKNVGGRFRYRTEIFERRLERFAHRTGRIETYCAREAILDRLNDLKLRISKTYIWLKAHWNAFGAGQRRGSCSRMR
jgi:hypothetical protein